MTRKQRINDLILNALHPVFLTVDDESHKHHVPEGMESHFNITLVSKQFQNLKRVARHRLVHTILTEEFNQGLHALSLHLFSPEEWDERATTDRSTPACRDGYRHG